MKLLSVALALLGLAAIASAYQVQRDPCAWGPTYWCKSRTNAQQCRQVHYCRENFWKSSVKMSTLVNAPSCDMCKVVVGYLDQVLKANKTEQEAKDTIEKVCSYLGSVKEECSELVDEYFDMIWQILVSEVDPNTICRDLGLCNSTIAVSSTATPKTSFSSDKECGVCTRVVDDIGKVVNSSMTEEAAKLLAKQVCDYLGPAAPECRLLIDMFFDDIWKMLDKELTPQEICEQLKLCSKSVSKVFIASQKSQFDIECSLCKTLIGEVVKKLLNTSTAQDRIKSLIEEVCNSLPNGTDQNECRVFIDSFFPTIWKLLINDIMTPDQVCSLLGVCGNKTVSRHRAQFLLRRVSLKGSDPYPYCDICKEVDEVLESFLNNANETEVKEDLKDLCRYLPNEASQCSDLVDNYFDIVWSILLQYVGDPEQFCELINMCNSTAKSTKAVSSGAECDICKTLVQVADLFLTRNSTEEEVLSVLEKGCSFLPAEYGDECTDFVKAYGQTLYKLVISEIDPDKICPLLKACTTGVSNSGDLCEVCEEALGLVKSLLPGTTDTVVSFLTELCGLMPGALQDECKSFVKQYGPDLIPLIAGLIDPDKDCQMLGLCSQTAVLKIRRSL